MEEDKLRDVKVALPGDRIQPGAVLEIRLGRKVSGTQCRQRCICHPRRIAKNQHFVLVSLKWARCQSFHKDVSLLYLNFSFEFWSRQQRSDQACFALRYVPFLNLQTDHLANAWEDFERSDDEVSFAAGRFDQDFGTIAQLKNLLTNGSRQ